MSDSDSDGSLYGRHRTTKWRRKQKKEDSFSSVDTLLNIEHSQNDPSLSPAAADMDVAESVGDFEAGGDSEEDEDNYGYGDKGEGGGADNDNEEDHDLEIETDEDNHEEDRDLEAYEDDDDGDDDNNRDEDSEHEIDNENHEVDSRPMFAFPEGAMNRPLEVWA